MQKNIKKATELQRAQTELAKTKKELDLIKVGKIAMVFTEDEFKYLKDLVTEQFLFISTEMKDDIEDSAIHSDLVIIYKEKLRIPEKLMRRFRFED